MQFTSLTFTGRPSVMVSWIIGKMVLTAESFSSQLHKHKRQYLTLYSPVKLIGTVYTDFNSKVFFSSNNRQLALATFFVAILI